MSDVTVETYEMTQEPRYPVVIRGAVLLLAVVATQAEANSLTAPCEHNPEMEASVISLPGTLEDQQNLSDLLEALTRKVKHVTLRDEIRLELKVAPRVDED